MTETIIEYMEKSKNPFERIHWQTCNLFWDGEQDLDELYETGKEVYEVGKQLLEACEGLLKFVRGFDMGGDLMMDNYPAIKKALTAIRAAKGE